MTFFRTLLFVCPAACLLAQTPPKPATPSAAPPLPTVSLSSDANAGSPNVAPDKVVLTIGDTKITAAQFDHIVNSLPPQFQANARGAGRKQFADNVVRIFVLSEEGKKRKLDQSDAFKDQQLFQNANMLAGLTYDALGKDAGVDAAEVQKYYEAHKGEFERVKARHILIRSAGSPLPVKPGAKELSDADALAKAQEIRKKIEAGADFATVARAESDDTTSGEQGGDLGFFGRNQMVPPFEEAAFAMKPGELSQPVKTPFGYHIIKCEAKESKSLEEMKPDIEKRLRPEQAQKVMENLQKKTNVVFDPEFFPGTAPAPAPAATPQAK
jgi:parvulin-like peptidyl-prolyl isomerase